MPSHRRDRLPATVEAHYVVTQLAWAESQLGILVSRRCHVVDFAQTSAAGVETRIQQGRRLE